MTIALANNASMDERLLKLLIREIAQTASRGTTSGPQDSRHDLGYGKSFNDKQSQRMSNSNFPYSDPDPYQDLEYTEEDQDTSKKVADKMYVAKTNDPGDVAKSDPFYFVAGNTKLSDCFSRVDDVLLEVEVAKNSLTPTPGTWNKAPRGSGGGASYITLKTGKVGGTKKGWSKPHDKVAIEAEEEESQGIMSVWDILKNQRYKKGLE